MMGFFGKIGSEFARITKPYPDEQKNDEFGVFSEFPGNGSKKVQPAYDSANSNNKVRSIHATTKLQVVVVQPEHFEGITDIGDHLLSQHTVVLNLEKVNKEAKQRIVDFLSGVVFALSGNVKTIAKNAYIITPSKIDIMGGDLIGELESSGLYL